MKASIFAVATSALFSFAAAWTAPVGANPQGNPISKPGLNEVVPVGTPYTITWTPTSESTISLILLRGPSTNVIPMYALGENIPNTGSFTWILESNLEADVTHYGIQLIEDATGFYQYTTQFGISNSVPAVSSSSTSAAPVPSTSSTILPTSAVIVPTTSAVIVPTTSAVIVPTTSAVIVPTTSVISSISSSTSAVVPTTIAAVPTTIAITSAAGTISYSTRIVTITSCGTAVTNCPAVTHLSSAAAVTSAPAVISDVPVVVAPPVASWSNNTLTQTTPTNASVIASTGLSSPISTDMPLTDANAGGRIRVGCAMVAVMVAAFALAM